MSVDGTLQFKDHKTKQ